MSQENVELVRSIYAAWECGDFSSAEWADPEIEYAAADGPLIGTWRGLEGMAEAMREFLRAWDEGREPVPCPRRHGDKARPILRPRARARRPRPRSRVGGVGGVAGERGAGPQRLRGACPSRYRSHQGAGARVSACAG